MRKPLLLELIKLSDAANDRPATRRWLWRYWSAAPERDDCRPASDAPFVARSSASRDDVVSSMTTERREYRYRGSSLSRYRALVVSADTGIFPPNAGYLASATTWSPSATPLPALGNDELARCHSSAESVVGQIEPSPRPSRP